MRTTQTFTISLPPSMLEEFEQVRKAENRTRSELVRAALRAYFRRGIPLVESTHAELDAIRRGRAEIKRGDFVTLAQLRDELASQDRRTGAKSTRKVSR